MFTQTQIKKEVWGTFGKDASKIDVGYAPHIDGVFIKVSKKLENDIISLTHCLSSLELLQAQNPLAMLKSRIAEMHTVFKQELKKKEVSNADLRST